MWSLLLTVALAAWPVDPHQVVAGFDRPSAPWAAGHRGVDFAAAPGDSVRAVRSGTVAFAGTVAGKPVVTIALGDGRRLTYEPVLAAVALGTAVAEGQLIGRLAAAGGHCAGGCLHLGLLAGDVYVDPRAVLPIPPAVLKPIRHHPVSPANRERPTPGPENDALALVCPGLREKRQGRGSSTSALGCACR